MKSSQPRTLFDKVWSDHVVRPETDDTPAILYIDLHLIHEVTTPQAFSLLRDKGLPVRRPDLTLATMDHSTPTTPVRTFKDLEVAGEGAARQVRQMEQNCKEFGVDLLGFDSDSRGIVHVIGPGCVAPSSGPMTWTMPRLSLSKPSRSMPKSLQFCSICRT